SGTQGATHSPSFNPQGDKVVWLEMAKDGYESDHAAIVIYDLKKDVSFVVAKNWDRSPDSIQVRSHECSASFFNSPSLASFHTKELILYLPPVTLVKSKFSLLQFLQRHPPPHIQPTKKIQILLHLQKFTTQAQLSLYRTDNYYSPPHPY